MIMLQAHAFFRTITMSIVPDRTPSREVHVGLLLVVQPPLEEVVIPAAAMRDAACAWVSGVPVRSTISDGIARTAEAVARTATAEVNYDDVRYVTD
jgi:hypothetical protein